MSSAVAAVLTYHRITEIGTNRDLLCVPPATFSAQMRYLQEHKYWVISLDELADSLTQATLPPRAIALTFDDGYLDSLTTAAAVLTQYKFPASFFVVTTMQDQPCEFWWDSLERAFGDTCDLPDCLCLTIHGTRLVLPTATAVERRAAHGKIRRAMYSLCKNERDEMVDTILYWSGTGRCVANDRRTMTGAEIKALDDLPGMSVGSHTVNHLLLPAQIRAVKRRELEESKRSLEALLNRDITTLCYPYGGFDLETLSLARELGYRCAVSTGNVPVTSACSPFSVPRIAVRAGDDLSARLRGAFCSASPDCLTAKRAQSVRVNSAGDS